MYEVNTVISECEQLNLVKDYSLCLVFTCPEYCVYYIYNSSYIGNSLLSNSSSVNIFYCKDWESLWCTCTLYLIKVSNIIPLLYYMACV